MRAILLLTSALFASGVSAQECAPAFNESELLAAIGKKPEKRSVKKEDGQIRHQYEFRKEPNEDELFSEDASSKFEPQFYVTIYNPPCAKKIKVWFYGRDGKPYAGNVDLAGNAFEYLTGVNKSIFENKISKFEGVDKFESFDDKANSTFLYMGRIYSIDIVLK